MIYLQIVFYLQIFSDFVTNEKELPFKKPFKIVLESQFPSEFFK